MTRDYDVVVDGGAPAKMWTRGVPVEPKTMAQIVQTSRLPFIFKHVAVMPDAHWGMGSTVGTVVPTQGAIVPACVGVDLGCGMVASMTNLRASDLPDNLRGMRFAIEAAVPHGRTDHGQENDRGAWGDVPDYVNSSFGHGDRSLDSRLRKIIEKHPKMERRPTRAVKQFGTLGTGNHFVEVCLDREQRVWVMLHSGSRGVGNAIAKYFIEHAQSEMERWFIRLPDQNLAYIPEGSTMFDDYIEAVGWAQDYAFENRQLMLDATLRAMTAALGREVTGGVTAINCHHNYVEKEHHFGQNVWITRKGAVRARVGDLGIIPGSMGAKSFIVRGLGNPDSFHTCSHGAGRVMSRDQARKRITLADHDAATAGIECRKDASVLDESPAAYKNIDAVMAAQTSLVEVVEVLKQVLVVKG